MSLFKKWRPAGKHHDLFWKTFLGLLLMSFATVCFLGFWMNRSVSRNYREAQARANLGRLRQTDEALGLTVEVMSQSMEQTLWSSDFITELVNPNDTTVEQNYRIIRQLESIQSGDSLVKTAFLYAPYPDQVYTDRDVYGRAEFSDAALLSSWLHGETPYFTISGRRTETSLVSLADRLFLIQEIRPGETAVGILVYELNDAVLKETLALGEITVYDADGRAVFQTEDEAVSPDLSDPGQFLTEENADREAGSRTKGFYRYDSPESGWRYLLPMDTAALTPRFFDVLPAYAAAALLFLSISVLFDLYISRAVYQPINRLMQLVSREDGARERTGEGEADFLAGAYSDAIGNQNRLEGMIADIAPEILDSMLKNLMVGKKLAKERVAEILAGVGNPILIKGRYVVLVCRFEEAKGRESTDVELNLHLLSVRKIVNELVPRDYRIYDIHTEKLIVALVMGFDAEYPVVAIKRECQRLSKALKSLDGQLPYRISSEPSSIYQNLMDIRAAYKEAVGQLQYEQYMESSEESRRPPETKEEESGEKLISRRYLKERVKALSELAAGGQKESCTQLLDQIMADLSNETEADFLSQTGYLMDLLTDRAVSLPLSAEEQALLETARRQENTDGAELRVKREIQLRMYAELVVKIMQDCEKKNSYRYVRLAKEYLEEHYSDSSLSLNDVGEKTGISGSYLSELFYEVTKEKFSSYLAALRVEKAGQLLRTTNMTITEIGYLCGFNSIQNFIRVFKKQKGKTPGQYRDQAV